MQVCWFSAAYTVCTVLCSLVVFCYAGLWCFVSLTGLELVCGLLFWLENCCGNLQFVNRFASYAGLESLSFQAWLSGLVFGTVIL